MKPRITFLTLGVDDLQRALEFYRDGLGFPTRGIVGQEYEDGAVVFFELQSGLTLALWPRGSIAHDARVRRGSPSPTEFTIGYNVPNREHVDAGSPEMAQYTRRGFTLRSDS